VTLLLRGAHAVVRHAETDGVDWNVDLLVEGGRVSAIGKGLTPPPGTTIMDARHWIIYPGLINTHHHFFQALVRNRANLVWPADVLDWISRIYPVFARLPAEAFFHATLITLADLIKHGCTTAFDHQYCFPAGVTVELVDAQFSAADLLGMRFHAGRGTNTLEERHGGVVPQALVESPDRFLKDCERLIDRYHDSGPFAMRRVVVAPCQPANCTAQTFSDSVALARSRGVRMHTHLGEGESAVMLARTGLDSIDWCAQHGFTGSDVWFAHGWEFDRGAIGRLAASDTGISHCPAPVFLVGERITDVVGMLDAGLRVGLGCDGQASNDASNLLECVRLSYLLQTLAAGLYGRRPATPGELFHAATVGGAAVLGCPELGRLEPGMAADFFAVDIDRLEFAGVLHDPVSLLAKVGVSGPVSVTVINGRVVWRQGELTGLDEGEHIAAANKLLQEINVKAAF
jgi:hydroxyatrazine ethylaminohydrolase